jgi:hypothetical protein
VPSSCVKYVKQYTDGELTLPDYVKSLKICKQNEEIAKQIAKTSKSLVPQSTRIIDPKYFRIQIPV